MSRLKSDRPCALLLGLCSLSGGATLAWHHPLWPVAALSFFALWSLVVAWRAGIWLLVVPACVGFLNFAPWTGWFVFDEFDLLLLGTLTGGYARWAFRPPSGPGPPASGVLLLLTALLGGFALWALFRGWMDAADMAFDWFAGYTNAMNSVRVFKSQGFALLCMPLLQQEISRSSAQSSKRLATGMVAGLAIVTLAGLWERAAFPGVLNFTAHYRTVALFWEMHVGGAAIDGYLALSAPFAVWAVLSAHRPVSWVGAAALALLAGYAILTTFARGVYFAIAGALVLLGVLLRAQTSSFTTQNLLPSGRQGFKPMDWRAKAYWVLVLALMAEVALVLGTGSFMLERLASTDRDFTSRMEHWKRGLDLLENTSDWWLGKGLGRLPPNYANHTPWGEFSGDVRMREVQMPSDGLHRFVTIYGPKTREKVGGLYALTQRVSGVRKGQYQVSLDIRSPKETEVRLQLCERHLLYDGACQSAFVRVSPGDRWQPRVLQLQGDSLEGGPWYAPRLAMFSLSVVNVGGVADFDNLRLIGPGQHQGIENGNFSHGLAHWFHAAQSYFLPWHVDNLFLEIGIERGISGLLLWFALVGYALWQLVFDRTRPRPLAPYLAASLSAALCIGLVSSLMDAPRVAFLLYFLTLYSVHPPPRQETSEEVSVQGFTQK